MTPRMSRNWGTCVVCGADIFLKNGMDRKYCDACKVEVRRKRARLAKRKKRRERREQHKQGTRLS